MMRVKVPACPRVGVPPRNANLSAAMTPPMVTLTGVTAPLGVGTATVAVERECPVAFGPSKVVSVKLRAPFCTMTLTVQVSQPPSEGLQLEETAAKPAPPVVGEEDVLT